MHLEANGSDKRGNGTAGATVTAQLEPDGDGATRVVVDTDLKVTGRPAQFGRGVLQDVGGRIIEQFAACLATRMADRRPSRRLPAGRRPRPPPRRAGRRRRRRRARARGGAGPLAGARAGRGPGDAPADPSGDATRAELDLGSVVLPTPPSARARRAWPGSWQSWSCGWPAAGRLTVSTPEARRPAPSRERGRRPSRAVRASAGRCGTPGSRATP